MQYAEKEQWLRACWHEDPESGPPQALISKPKLSYDLSFYLNAFYYLHVRRETHIELRVSDIIEYARIHYFTCDETVSFIHYLMVLRAEMNNQILKKRRDK